MRLQNIVHSPTRLLMLVLTTGSVLSTRYVIPTYADTSSVSCKSLTVTPTQDASQYNFTAKASGKSTIIGYTFDFGDKQSYAFSFSADGTQDRSQATVSHTYPAPGVYTATVYVNIESKGNATSITSRNCHTTVNDGPTILANTGVRNTPEVFAAAFVLGLISSEVWLKYYRGHTAT